jgi:hypothetical protein
MLDKRGRCPLPNIEKPEEFNTAVREFLDGI